VDSINVQKKKAKVRFNDDIYIVSPMYDLFTINKVDFSNIFPCTIDDASLGIQLKDALESSLLDWSHEVDSVKQAVDKHKEWCERVIAKYNYKSKRAFFVNMNSCSIIEMNDTLLFVPYRHEKLEGWGTEKGDEQYEIGIPATSSLELIGKTLRIALERASKM
jgi:hypothetical protein